MNYFDVIIIGAGAAGMMCAIEVGKRGRSVLLLERSKSPGDKIRISGGGRCNFTNLEVSAANYLSENPKFAISALSQYTQTDFISLIDQHGIAWHEKTLGQLFCDGSARQIIDMLLSEMADAGVTLRTNTEVETITKIENGFSLVTSLGPFTCASLVVACGGKSIPKMGATNFGYKIAEQFEVKLTETRPALVPLTFDPLFLERWKPLAGVAVEAIAKVDKRQFREALLITHRGLSGPAILQISSYWREGDILEIDLAPDQNTKQVLLKARTDNGRQELASALAPLLPKRLAQAIAEEFPGRIADANDKTLNQISARIHNWQIKPTGTEGYRTAEVTLGGVATSELNARTLEAKSVPGLHFIGEVVDVTGWLGGYNFQWAWSSGWAAGQAV